MLMTMKVIESQGFSKEKAFKDANIDVELGRLKNATQAWKKAGSPLNSKALNAFMSKYIKDKKAVGAYLVIESAVDDTRVRPYTIINEVTTGKRKSKTVYQVKEAELKVKYVKEVKEVTDEETGEVTTVDVLSPYTKKVIQVEVVDKETKEVSVVDKEVNEPNVTVVSVGAVEGRSERKDKALKIMKELMQANKKDYVIEIVKEITTGQKYAGYGQYTPSKSAKVGKFMFFVEEV